ncbi:MAG: formate dehydrogenase subunit gamma, partial [Pseudomonadota bacterium]|nr:formate dehydrogenase subunit gamma [Pseudomonadota bacterium]
MFIVIEKGMIKVSSAYERIVHWYLALTCLLLILTGLSMMFHSFNFIGVPFGGLKTLKMVHIYAGFFFIPALLLAAITWWKEAGTFDLPDDIEWLAKGGGYLWKVDKVPETGKYNPGQKIFFLTIVIFGLAMIVSGLLITYPEGQSKDLINWMYALHALGVVVIFSFIIIHIYLGTVGVPGLTSVVFSGYTTRDWCLSKM